MALAISILSNLASAASILAICEALGITATDALKAPTAIILKRPLCRFERRLISAFVVPTKEGEMTYPLDQYQILFSVSSKGRLLNHNGQADVYAWTQEAYAKKAKKCVPVGVNAPEAKENLEKLLSILVDGEEKVELVEWFSQYAVDQEMVFTKAEWRKVIPVTRALYEAGVTQVVNSWDEGENPTVTPLAIGDVLVVEKKPEGTCLYRIEHDAFVDSHPDHAFLVAPENL